MKKRFGLVWPVVLFFICFGQTAVLAQEEMQPYKVLMHTHTDNSDGRLSAQELMDKTVENGYDGLVVADHYDQVIKKYPNFDDYARLFADPPLTYRNRLLIVIIGAEITCRNQNGSAHVLAVPVETCQPELLDLSQSELLAKLKALGKLSFAAHPCQDKYIFDQTQTEGLTGIELLNDLLVANLTSEKSFQWILKLAQAGQYPTLTAGADIHGYPNEKIDRWQRATWILAQGATRQDFLDSLAHGATYVSQFDTRIEPEDRVDELHEFGFDCKIIFSHRLTAGKKVQMYLNGQLVKSSVQYWLPGKREYHYHMAYPDEYGKYHYVFEVVGYLVANNITYEYKTRQYKTRQ